MDNIVICVLYNIGLLHFITIEANNAVTEQHCSITVLRYSCFENAARVVLKSINWFYITILALTF